MSSRDDNSKPVFKSSQDGAGDAGQEKKPSQDIDLQTLANKVFALLKQELRVERERLGRNRF